MSIYRLAAIGFLVFGVSGAALVSIANLAFPTEPLTYDGCMTLLLASCATGILSIGEDRKP